MADDNENDDQLTESTGGSGGLFVQGRADTALIERAVAEQWPIPANLRAAIVARQVKTATSDESSNREATSAARTLTAMMAQNMAAAHKALDKMHPDKFAVADSSTDELKELMNAIRADTTGAEMDRARAIADS